MLPSSTKFSKNFMKILAIVFLIIFSSNSTSLELACNNKPNNTPNKILVDCNNRYEVIRSLHESWLLLRKNYIGGQLEDICFEAYMDAKDIHPSIDMSSIVDVFFQRCNMGLEYLK
jgi:hypothetical protein